ncbi:Emopamil-binding protein [Mycobacterium paraffinicum]|uniref:Emopamil-binding protein n=1 Tax=Mycobacterium paraffinicum TaxID=53378 RepID=A0A1Q4HNC7_9MYCO|nr:Emopamil-binding protein [Mycobacterium paraffinicum]OJZ68995.1 Emopamil-binding protein [Mycobacterium paraffinicum]
MFQLPDAEQHNFTRPWAKERKRVYLWCAVVMMIAFPGAVVAAGVGLIPMVRATGVIACTVFTIPMMIIFITAWRDAPGENRTVLERANEFQMIWFFAAAAGSEISWETPWLIGDVMGWMHLTPQDTWGFAWWYYGDVDRRYLTSDGALWGLELAVVTLAVILLVQWFRLRKAGNHDPKRINALWWAFFSMAGMLALFVTYFLMEVRHGFSDFQLGFWEITVILGFENLPWLIAPVVSLPFVARQIMYLVRTSPPASSTPSRGAAASTSVGT